MPHQNTNSTKATAQNAAVGSEQNVDKPPSGRTADEPRSYAAPDVAEASVAPPAAGEIPDYMDEGEPSFGAHQGVNHTNRELHAKNPKADQQGARTRAANKDIVSRRGAG
jgi:hypothetical protein